MGTNKKPRRKIKAKPRKKKHDFKSVDDLVPASQTEKELDGEDKIEKELIDQLYRYRSSLAKQLTEKDNLDSPLSETLKTGRRVPKKTQTQMTARHCIALLRAMAEAEPQRAFSRNYFRNHSGIDESTWIQYFGTFEQFKRSAGITLSRGAHRLSLDISKHAGADVYERIGSEREKFRTKYDRPCNKRYQTMLVASDFHDVEVDPFSLRVFVDTALRIQPEVICLAGDFFDLYEFSRFTQDPRDFSPAEKIKYGHEILSDLREAAPDAQIDLIEGNHEMRLLRHLADATPAMITVLSELHGFTIPSLLGLDEFGVNYIGRGSLKARSFSERAHRSELGRNWRSYFGCVLAHHFPQGKDLRMPGFHGHHHLHKVWSAPSIQFGGPYEWHQLGGMCRRVASFTDGERWSNGFLIVHVDTQRLCPNFEYVPVTNIAVVGGEYYERGEDELIWDDPNPGHHVAL